MAKREGRSIRNHHIVFALASLGMLLTTVWAFYDDFYNREYPHHQLEYFAQEQARVEGELKAVNDELKKLAQQEWELEEAYWKAVEKYNASQGKLADAKAAVKAKDDVLAQKRLQLNFAGTDVGVYNYDWTAAVEQGKDAKLKSAKGKENERRDLFNEVKMLEREREELQNKVNEIEKPKADAEKALQAMKGRWVELSRSAAKIQGNPIINLIKDAPGLDFVDPRFNLNDQVVLTHLPVDLVFGKTQRVDRCVSCHKGIDNTDSRYREQDPEKLPAVLRSHPRLDLFVASNSPHSVKKFGCTICHQGRGWGTSFLRAAHTPRNPAQAEQWKKDYGWSTLDHHAPGIPLWDNPMLPMQYVEASCAKCHKGVDSVPEAKKLNQGRELFRERGCANCHMGTSDPDTAWLGRIGPDLRRIGEKTDVLWTQRWIENPWEFRPDTRMPRLFGLENRRADQDRGQVVQVSYDDNGKASENASHAMPRDPVEIEAITTYLFATSKLREQKLPEPPKGDAARGKEHFEQFGCLGCHSTTRARDKHNLNEHGPDLSRVGEKVRPAWLFEWLKNPQHYWAETRMPSLRLTNDEAANLTAYLTSEAFKKQDTQYPDWKPAPLWADDAMVRDLIVTNTPEFRVREMLADPDGLVRVELKKKVKYAVMPGGKDKVDTGQGEWTEPQIDALLKILDGMGQDEAGKEKAKKSFFAGAGLIQHYGCYACHNIQGWTYAPLSCVNLQGEGDKDVTKFEFGNMALARTRWDWIYLKLARPRSFDDGKLPILRPLDRLRMPWYGLKKDSHPTQPAGHGAHAQAPGGTHAAASGGGPVHAKTPEELALANPDMQGLDKDSGLTHEEIEALVTVVLSYTNEQIPKESMKHLSTKDVAVDRGERVVKALNCIGCHNVGLSKPATLVDAMASKAAGHLVLDAGSQGRLRLEAVAVPEAQAAAEALGVFSERDEVNLEAAGLSGFLHFGRGTYLLKDTVPIVLAEKRVSRPPEPEVPIGFYFLKQRQYDRLKEGKERWVKYRDILGGTEGNQDLGLKRFTELTHFLFQGNAEALAEAWKKSADNYVNIDAYERLAGTEALTYASPALKNVRISRYELGQRLTAGTAWLPVELSVRWMHGEGRIIPHVLKTPGATTQNAPPGLAFEGGKVQPDWFYGFLQNVHPLRPSVTVRMPSFWLGGRDGVKQAYPAGRTSVLKAGQRPTGVGGEPEPPVPLKVEDDALQLVNFFGALAGEKAYGYQPQPLMDAATQKSYVRGFHLLLANDPQKNPEGISCVSCHSVGTLETAAPKGPNLIFTKRRFKDEWLRRFLIYPKALHPWAVMPANFFDWTSYEPDFKEPLRGLSKNDEAEFKKTVERLNTVIFFLESSGEAEVGTTPQPK